MDDKLKIRLLQKEANEVSNLLAEALGYSKGEPGNPDSYATGDHTVVTLAMEAANKLKTKPKAIIILGRDDTIYNDNGISNCEVYTNTDMDVVYVKTDWGVSKNNQDCYRDNMYGHEGICVPKQVKAEASKGSLAAMVFDEYFKTGWIEDSLEQAVTVVDK